MKLLLILLVFCSFGISAQNISSHYLRDTFELNEAYLYEKANGWFTQDDEGLFINFTASEEPGRRFKLHDWIKSGNYSAPINMLTDSSFSFTIEWTNEKGVSASCDYVGTMTVHYLKKSIRFKTDTSCTISYPSLYEMVGNDAWPGFIPATFGLLSGKVVKTDCYNMEINEPSLALNIINETGDSLYVEIFFDKQLGSISNYKHEYFLNKQVQCLYYIPHGGKNFYAGWKMIIDEGKK